jgi:hypothetical protein
MAYDFLLASQKPPSEDREVRMRRFLSAPAVIVVTLSLLAQTSPSPGKPEGHPASSCIVGGRVVTAVEGSPLKSARVSLVPEHVSSSYTSVCVSSLLFLRWLSYRVSWDQT